MLFLPQVSNWLLPLPIKVRISKSDLPAALASFSISASLYCCWAFIIAYWAFSISFSCSLFSLVFSFIILSYCICCNISGVLVLSYVKLYISRLFWSIFFCSDLCFEYNSPCRLCMSVKASTSLILVGSTLEVGDSP